MFSLKSLILCAQSLSTHKRKAFSPTTVSFRGKDQYCETAPREWGNTKLSNHPDAEAGRGTVDSYMHLPPSYCAKTPTGTKPAGLQKGSLRFQPVISDGFSTYLFPNNHLTHTTTFRHGTGTPSTNLYTIFILLRFWNSVSKQKQTKKASLHYINLH